MKRAIVAIALLCVGCSDGYVYTPDNGIASETTVTATLTRYKSGYCALSATLKNGQVLYVRIDERACEIGGEPK